MTVKKLFSLILLLLIPFWLSKTNAFSQGFYSFPKNTVTNIIVVPSDIEMDPEYPRLVSEAVKKVQQRYAEILGGQTFQINEINGDPIIIHTRRTVAQICWWNAKPNDPINPAGCNWNNNILMVLGEEGLPSPFSTENIIFNTFLVSGREETASEGSWDENFHSGMTLMYESELSGLKEGKINNRIEIICQIIFNSSCSKDTSIRVIAHELGHAFGLSGLSRWAKGHPCSTASQNECKPDLDKKFYPNPDEWNYSIIGYGSHGRPLQSIGLNDSCVNPEKTILRHHPFFGGSGYDKINFENCLKPPIQEIKITKIEADEKIFDGDTINIYTEGLLPDDQDIKVIFPHDVSAFLTKKITVNKIEAVVPAPTVSGDIIIQVKRDGQQVHSIPHPIEIYSPSPQITEIEPKIVKIGDTITIYGNWPFLKKQGGIKGLSVSIANQFLDPIEQGENYIKAKIPQNVQLGTEQINISLDLYENSKKTHFLSNSVPVIITGNPEIEAKIELPDEGLELGKRAEISAFIRQQNSTPESAEMWVYYYQIEECKGDKRIGNFCRIGKADFSVGTPGEFHKFTGTFIPPHEQAFLIVVNIFGTGGIKCSGDRFRPPDWLDCGVASRINAPVNFSRPINIKYSIFNKSNKQIRITPRLCVTSDCSYAGSYTSPIPKGSSLSFEYNFYFEKDGSSLKKDRIYKIGCGIWRREGDESEFSVCLEKEGKSGDYINIDLIITDSEIQVGKEGGESTISSSPTVKSIPSCSLSFSSSIDGKNITWTIKSNLQGTSAYWRGSNNGISIIPTDVEGYSNTTSWSQEYKYTVPGYYERFVGIQDKEGKTVCTTDKVSITVPANQVFLQTIQRSEPGNTALPIGQGQSAPNQTTQNLQKSVVSILVNGARMNFANKISIHLPETIVRGETHPIPITVSYGGEGSVRENSRSQILVFRYIVPGSENSGEKFSQEQACDPAKYSCFVMSEQESGSPERLFCRNMGDGYKWVTQKHAYELCQSKDGITSACKNKEGNETTYYCTGRDWVDKDGWAVHQEKLKKAQEALKPHEVLPSGKIAEDIKETQKRLEEESKGLSCSLEARPQGIKVGGDIAWTIETQNFTGVSAQWHGTDNGQEFAGTVPVHEFPKPKYPNSWTESYSYQKGGIYIRYARVKDSEGRTCQTNALGVVIEDSNIAQGILPAVGRIPSSITEYVNQIGPKTVKQIVLLLPPYGQQREVKPGDKIQFSLPDTGGVPQTIQVPISIIYSDGSTGSKTISFSYKGNTCALSNGKCADSNGDTQDSYHCDEFRSDLSGCSLDKDRAHPYCYTKCSPKGTAPSGAVQTPQPAQTPTPTQAPTTDKDCSPRYTCADSAGITADRTKKCDLGTYRSDYTGCAQQYYCYTSCGPNQTSTLPQTGTATANCSGAGEFCADSGGTPKDSGTRCITGNKAYRNNSAKDQWCQQGTPGWYCWLCQQ